MCFNFSRADYLEEKKTERIQQKLKAKEAVSSNIRKVQYFIKNGNIQLSYL